MGLFHVFFSKGRWMKPPFLFLHLIISWNFIASGIKLKASCMVEVPYSENPPLRRKCTLHQQLQVKMALSHPSHPTRTVGRGTAECRLHLDSLVVQIV